MARTLTGAMASALAADVQRPALLAKIATAGGDVRLWSGTGDLTFNSEIYLGAGRLGGVSEIEETTAIEARGARFTLSGIPSALIATALDDIRQGLSAKLWLALFDGADPPAMIADPYLIFEGLTDTASIEEGAETAVISITAESRLIDLERPRVRRYTPEDQHIDAATDKGFDMVAALQDKEIVFGRS